MNLTVKRCLVGLVASAAMFGIARAQDDESAGTVQLGPQLKSPVQAAPAAQVQAPVQPGLPPDVGQTFNPLPAPGTISLGQPGQPMLPGQQFVPGRAGNGNVFQITPIDQVFVPRYYVNSYGGGLYGYGAGYASMGAFVPYKLEENALLFAAAQGMVTYDGRGGASVGGGWRYYMPGMDRIAGLSAWYDLDNGHAQPYQQLGLSLESLGRYFDFRANGYAPVSHPDHILQSNLTQTASLIGNGIGLLRNNVVEQAFGGYDAEIGGPTPVLGRYGLNMYVGGYQLLGMGTAGGGTVGVSGRLLAQINEDVSFGVQVTNDHLFGLNTQYQLFVNLPNGKSGRWLRNLRVRDRLNQNVFRQYRVLAKVQQFETHDLAVNPGTHQPYFVENINPNLKVNGNGSAENPFNSIAAYEALPLSARQRVDIILVQPRADATTTNLDTGALGTLELFNGQRLLSTSIAHTFTTDNFPGVTMTIPAAAGATAPMLFNSTGGDVITLASGNTRGMEVSGFEIIGSATGNGIVGNQNLNVNINNNNIHDGLNGVSLTNLSGSFAAGTQSMFLDNNIHDNLGSGVQVTNSGSPPFVNPLDIVVQGNIFANNGGDGMKLAAVSGATIEGLIGGANIAATATTPAVTNANIFNANGANGLDLVANGGTLNFKQDAIAATPGTLAIPAFGIFNNTFTANTLDGLHIDTSNNSIASFLVTNNSFGLSTDAASGNKEFGIGLVSDSGTTVMEIGGNITTNADGTKNNPGNLFSDNVVSAIDLSVTGTGTLFYGITNNTITNALSATIAPPHDEFTFTFNGTSGVAPFIITNLSDPGVNINSVTWNLAGTPATIVPPTIPPLAGNPATLNNGPVVQPINNTDIATGLTAINGVPIVPGSNPLRIQAVANQIADTSLAGVNLPKFSQLIPLTFNNFAPSTTAAPLNFQATAQFEQAGGSAPLTSASTVGSSVSVTFSNGLVSTVKLAQPSPLSPAVSAQGDVFGTAVPGFGTGVDGIHVVAGGASTSNGTINLNTITGYGHYGIEVASAGTATHNVTIENNTVENNGTGVNGAGVSVFTGGGVNLFKQDSSVLAVELDNNIITQNFNTGLTLTASGTATGGLFVDSHDNNISNNAGNGLQIDTSGAAVLNFTTTRDNFNGNGSGSGKNPVVTGGDAIAINTSGTSVLNLNLINILANFANGNGLSATTTDSSTLNLVVDTVADPLFTGSSSFSNNKLNGVLLTSDNDSYMHANFYNTVFTNNTLDGVTYSRNGASLVRSSFVNDNFSNNGVNGLSFHGLGSDPQDPNQQMSGTANKIILINDSLNFNGNFTTGVGQGLRLDLFGDSELILDANATTFSNNAQNGIRIKLTPGAEFGYELGNERSILDNVQVNNNGSNGIFLTSDISPVQQASLNNNLPFDAPSVTFMQISSNTGNTTINSNGFGTNATGLSGILMQYLGGNHDILITGDENPATPGFSTVIQSNKADGILSQTSLEGDVLLTVDKVIVGGPVASQGNGADGIAFETQASLTIVDGAFTEIRNFNGSGIATLNLSNSLVQNNLGNGVNLIGNDFTVNDGSFGNAGVDLNGILNATITDSTIINNAKDGVNILLEGQMGQFREPIFATNPVLSTFTLTGNTISSNGLYGVRSEQNAGEQQPFVVFLFNDPQPTNPPAPFDPVNFGPPLGPDPVNWNTSTNAPVPDFQLFSNWLDLSTVNNAALNIFNNTIQFNGKQGDIVQGVGAPGVGSDGVFIRVGTNAYQAANIQNNTISGNVGNDLHIESFVAYNPFTGKAFEPNPALTVARAAPALDQVELDHTAQLDLNLTGNVGNTISIQSPLVNFGQFPTRVPLPGNTTPNGAVVGGLVSGSGDGLKTNFLFGNPGFVDPPARIVQLFQVNNSANLNTSNSFTQNGFTQDLINGPEGFFQADWGLRSTNGPFPDPNFPYSFSGNPFGIPPVPASPGNPFSP